MEAVVAREVRALGYEQTKSENGRVLVQTDDPLAIPRLNIGLRTAGRVQILVARFGCTDFGELFDRTAALPWEEGIPRDGRFPVAGRCVKSQLHSEPDCQRLVKKAIAKRLAEAYRIGSGQCPETGATYAVRIGIDRDEALLTIDTTGEGLHRRGYRLDPGEAALRETMAASLLQLSHWSPGRVLVDPFCGTGTILIEAAWMASDRAPGLRREFASEFWPRLPLSDRPAALLFSQARDEAESRQTTPDGPIRLFGSDIQPKQIARANEAAARAGVADRIELTTKGVDELRRDDEYGCLVSNPPYGERLDRDDLQTLHATWAAFAHRWRAMPTWGAFVLSALPEVEAIFGRAADRRRNLYNGPIACTYYQFHGPKPPREEK